MAQRITEGRKKYSELKEYENTKYKNLQDAAKAVFRKVSAALINICITEDLKSTT